MKTQYSYGNGFFKVECHTKILFIFIWSMLSLLQTWSYWLLLILYEFLSALPEKEKPCFFYERKREPNFCYESMQNKNIW